MCAAHGDGQRLNVRAAARRTEFLFIISSADANQAGASAARMRAFLTSNSPRIARDSFPPFAS